MSLLPFFQLCDTSWLGEAIRASTWAFALIECFHLIGMVCLLGSVVVIDLRLLGLGMRHQPVAYLLFSCGLDALARVCR